MSNRSIRLLIISVVVATILAIPTDDVAAQGWFSDQWLQGIQRVIGDRPVGERCVPDIKGWTFEQGLGIPVLGGYDLSSPGNEFFRNFFGWLFFAAMAFAAVLALMVIAFGGVRYIASAGNTSRQAAAKKNIGNALLGLILAMASILILYTINPELTRLMLPELPDANVPGGERGCAGNTQTAQSTAEFCSSLSGSFQIDGGPKCTIPDPSNVDEGALEDQWCSLCINESGICAVTFPASTMTFWCGTEIQAG